MTLRRLVQIFRQRYLGTYDRRREKESASDAELAEQRAHQPEAGTISIVVPVYNTEPDMLEELIASLEAQTYADIEVVLHDTSTREETRRVLDRIRNPRFRLIRSAENLGISSNTNAAAAEAHGEYIALCDHDDVMAPDAIWRAADMIAKEHPDVIYTDEDRVMENGRHHMDPHYKPDWNRETLTGDNYICHLAVIRKELYEEVGGLRSGFDGSQDHDLFLRLAEKHALLPDSTAYKTVTCSAFSISASLSRILFFMCPPSKTAVYRPAVDIFHKSFHFLHVGIIRQHRALHRPFQPVFIIGK